MIISFFSKRHDALSNATRDEKAMTSNRSTASCSEFLRDIESMALAHANALFEVVQYINGERIVVLSFRHSDEDDLEIVLGNNFDDGHALHLQLIADTIETAAVDFSVQTLSSDDLLAASAWDV